jgi:hypothetical protein
MAETLRDDSYYSYQQQQQQQPITFTKTRTRKVIHPSTSQLIVLATLVPFGATLLILSGLTLTATVVGLAVTTPLFIFFSPVLLAAAVVIGLAIAGFLTSGAFGVTSLSSFAWVASYLRRSRFLEKVNVKHHHAVAKPPPRLDVDETLGNEAQITEEARDRVESVAKDTVQEEAQNDQREVGKTKKQNVKKSS